MKNYNIDKYMHRLLYIFSHLKRYPGQLHTMFIYINGFSARLLIASLLFYNVNTSTF